MKLQRQQSTCRKILLKVFTLILTPKKSSCTFKTIHMILDELLAQHKVVREHFQLSGWRNDIPIIDMHCHPSLKIYLLGKEIWEKHFVLPDVVPSGMHVDLPGMNVSNVKVAFCYHYIPEVGFGHLLKSECLFEFLEKFLAREIIEKFESDNNDAFQKAMISIDELNEQIETAKRKNFDVTVATNLSEFNTAWSANKTIIVNCLEGGHHLGRNLSIDQYRQRLSEFKRKGVCILTIGHFFPNAIGDTGGGIPPKLAHTIGYSKDIANGVNSPHPVPPGLSAEGHAIVEWCQENGMIIDLVHSSQETRTDIYAKLEARRSSDLPTVPVIISHSGIRENVAVGMNSNDQLILPNLDELTKLFSLDGMISILLMNYWTTGIEEDDLLSFDPGIKNILDTIETIHSRFNSYDNIGIGTDLDGFSQVPDDLKHVKVLGKLRVAITKKFGEDAAVKICYANALNVITKVDFGRP